MSTVQSAIGHLSLHVSATHNLEFWEKCASRSWEPETILVFDHFVDPSGCCIDVGAWIGPTTLYASSIAKHVFALEPDPIAFAELSTNIALNLPATANVSLFGLCIAPSAGTVSFGSRANGGDSMSSLLFADGNTSWAVEAVTFEQFISSNSISDCKFVKMDIEGAEYDVIPTMISYLAANRPTLYLSLHPAFLLNDGPWKRVQKTLALMRPLAMYRYFYNPSGRIGERKSLKTRFRRALDSIALRPFVTAMACLYAIRKNPTALVFSDLKW